MGAPAKITDEQWKAARKRYETDPKAGYGVIATEVLDCSRNLVARKAQSEGWAKRISASPHLNQHAPGAQGKFTENAVQRPTQSAHVYTDSPSTGRSSVALDAEAVRRVDSVTTEATANRSAPTDDDIKIPDGLDAWEREAFVRAVIVARQKVINATQTKELAAVKAKLYNAIKSAATGEGPALALAVERNVRSLVAMHDAELQKEIAKVKLDVAEFAGNMTPMRARIFVHLVPGVSFGGSSVPAVPGTRVVEVNSAVDAYGLGVTDVESREVDHE